MAQRAVRLGDDQVPAGQVRGAEVDLAEVGRLLRVRAGAGVDLSDETAVQRCLSDVGRLISEESALNLQDVIFRRTNLWEERDTACTLAPRICELFAWSESRINKELQQLQLQPL